MLLSSTSTSSPAPPPPPSSSSIATSADANINDDHLNIRSTPIGDDDDDDDDHHNTSGNNTATSPSSICTRTSSGSLSAASSDVGDDPKSVQQRQQQQLNCSPSQSTPASTTTNPLHKSLLANEDDQFKVDLLSSRDDDDVDDDDDEEEEEEDDDDDDDDQDKQMNSDEVIKNKAQNESRQVQADDDDDTRQAEAPSIELRLLVTRREAGALIGKRGSNIKRLRDAFRETSFSIPDTGNGPERVVCILTSGEALDAILHDLAGLFLEKSGQYDDQIELKLLIHSSHAGSIIGIGGQSIKKLRNDSKAAIKIYEMCCPFSNERVCAIKAKPPVVVNTIKLIQTILADNPIKGPISPYDALNFDLGLVDKYGGYLPEECPPGQELLLQARPPCHQALFAGPCSVMGQCPPLHGHHQQQYRRHLLNGQPMNQLNHTSKHYNSVWERQVSSLTANSSHKTPMSAGGGGQHRQQVASASNKTQSTQEAPLRNLRFHPYAMPRSISSSVPSASSHNISNNHNHHQYHHHHHHHPSMSFNKQHAFGVNYPAGLANCQPWRQAGSPTTSAAAAAAATTTTTSAIGHHQVAAVAEAVAAAAANLRSDNPAGPSLLAPCPCLFLPMAAAYHNNHNHSHQHHNHHFNSTIGHQSRLQATARANQTALAISPIAGPSLSPPDMIRRNS